MHLSPNGILIYYYRWIINVFLNVLRFQKRDKNIWIFGAWKGESYSDNAKYLFEYVTREHPEIRAVWITRESHIKGELLSKSRECYLYDDKEGRRLRRKAGFVFFTNGMTDLGDFDLCHGATKVALWHGMPLKKLWYATNYFQKKNLRSFVKRLTTKVYLNVQRDITIATSQKAKEFFMECFEVESDTVKITGQPRNDVLFNEYISIKINSIVKHASDEKFVLYMPTWRDIDYKGGAYLDEIIKELTSDDVFLKELEDRKIKFYIKPHPNLAVRVREKGNLKILRKSLELDSQELMAAADMMVTDYSSAFIDYALTDRPIHFFVPDLEDYKKGSLGIFVEFEDLADYWFKDIEELKKVILGSDDVYEKGISNTKKINAIYNDESLIKGEYSRQVTEMIKEL